MHVLSTTGDERFCSSDPELLQRFDVSSWWPPLFIALTVLTVMFTVVLLLCRVVFRHSVKKHVNLYGTLATSSSALMTAHTWLSIPGPLLTVNESTRLAVVYLSYAVAIAILSAGSFINLQKVRQISSFDVSMKVNIPSLKALWVFEIIFGVLPPIASVPVLIAYASTGCHIAGNYLRIVAAFLTVPQLASAATWITFSTMASFTLSKYQTDGVQGANIQAWNTKMAALKRKIVFTGLMVAFCTVMSSVPNAIAAYTFLLDESVEFHSFIRILGIVLMMLPSINHFHIVYASHVVELTLSKRNSAVLPSLAATFTAAKTNRSPTRMSSLSLQPSQLNEIRRLS